MWKNGNKLVVSIEEEYMGRENAYREQINERHARHEGILTRWLNETGKNWHVNGSEIWTVSFKKPLYVY
jgi:hypothetical protein